MSLMICSKSKRGRIKMMTKTGANKGKYNIRGNCISFLLFAFSLQEKKRELQISEKAIKSRVAMIELNKSIACSVLFAK